MLFRSVREKAKNVKANWLGYRLNLVKFSFIPREWYHIEGWGDYLFPPEGEYQGQQIKTLK